MQLVRMRSALAVSTVLVCLAAAAPARAGDPYVVDFFPEGQQIDHTIQLRFFGPNEGTITDVRLNVDFTTAAGFDAADLTILFVAPVASEGNFWFLTGEDLGWSGQGTFHANVNTNEMNGALQQGLWRNDIGSVLDPPAYSGTFSDTSHFEVDITPIPEPPCAAVIVLAMAVSARRRCHPCGHPDAGSL